MEDRKVILKIEHLCKDFDIKAKSFTGKALKLHALSDISLDIYEGETLGIIGESGCGKSTYLKTLNRMNDLVPGVKIDGTVLLDDEDIYDSQVDTTLLRKKIGMVFQQPNPFPMSIYDNIAYGPRIHGIKNKAQLDEIVENSLKGAALWDEVSDRLKKSALGLSGGQQQRVLIARALCATSSLLILDEPITGLDPTAIQEFYTMIRRLNREDKVAILMVSHDLRNAVEEANKILHLQKRVLFYGPAHDYMNSQAAGHFFHEKEQGRCKPTAGCHTVKLHMHKEDKS